MITILHNPRCRKSREGLGILEESCTKFEIRKYLEDRLTADELRTILKKLDMHPEELIRKNESIWKEKFRGKSWSEDQLIDAMITHPKLIERPIVINNNKAVVGRPPESILAII